MSLSTEDRRKQNRLNSKKSTGPTSAIGKAQSRQNSLKHGFTAVQLVLPTESTETIEAESHSWTDALNPNGFDQESLVQKIASESIQLQRLGNAETALVSEQVRRAGFRWVADQEHKLDTLKKLFRDDPSLAIIDLKTFTAGASWLAQRVAGDVRRV